MKILCSILFCVLSFMLIDAEDEKEFDLDGPLKELKKLETDLSDFAAQSQKLSPSKLSAPLVGNDDSNNDKGNENYGMFKDDPVFLYVAALSKLAKSVCGVDFKQILSTFSPVTLAEANAVVNDLKAVTQKLNQTLASTNGSADLKACVDSTSCTDQDIMNTISTTFETMDNLLSPIRRDLFCSDVNIIANRARMTKFGGDTTGNGFKNSYMCNSFAVTLEQYEMNADKVLKAVKDGESAFRDLAGLMADDIACHEAELAYFDAVVKSDPFSASDYIQVVAAIEDWYNGYTMTLELQKDVIELERRCLVAIFKENDKSQSKSVNNDESLGEQLQKLLDKLSELSAKEKATESKVVAKNSKSAARSMPTIAEKIAMMKKKSYYIERDTS